MFYRPVLEPEPQDEAPYVLQQEREKTLSPGPCVVQHTSSVKHLPVTATIKKVGQSQFYSSTPARTSSSSTPSDEEDAGRLIVLNKFRFK